MFTVIEAFIEQHWTSIALLIGAGVAAFPRLKQWLVSFGIKIPSLNLNAGDPQSESQNDRHPDPAIDRFDSAMAHYRELIKDARNEGDQGQVDELLKALARRVAVPQSEETSKPAK